jgi:hypothetical protein
MGSGTGPDVSLGKTSEVARKDQDLSAGNERLDKYLITSSPAFSHSQRQNLP